MPHVIRPMSGGLLRSEILYWLPADGTSRTASYTRTRKRPYCSRLGLLHPHRRSREVSERCGSPVRDVWVPNPCDVRGAGRCDDVVDVAAGTDVVAGTVAVALLGPGVPVAVHFVAEPEHHRVSPVGQPLAPLPEVRAEVPGGDAVQRIGRVLRSASLGPGLPCQQRLGTPVPDRLQFSDGGA